MANVTMSGETNYCAACTAAIASSIDSASLLATVTLHVGEEVHTRGREQCEECNTVLPELADAEVAVKCLGC